VEPTRPLRVPNIAPNFIIQRASLLGRVHPQPLQVERTQLIVPEARPLRRPKHSEDVF
jgi:hypothetical protein